MKTEIRNCSVCSQPFTAQVFEMGEGRTWFWRLCPPCTQMDRDAKKKAEAEREAQKRAQQWAAICPWEFRTADEGGNTDLARMDTEAPRWRELLKWSFGHRGLLVRGDTGRCKTRAVWRVLRGLFDRRISFVWLTAARFELELRAANFDGLDLIEEFAAIPVLFLDDIGKMAATDCVQSALFELIDARTREGRPVLVTTNDSGKSLAARLSQDRGEPMVRRLRDYCDLVTL